jgi:hypothetical protein
MAAGELLLSGPYREVFVALVAGTVVQALLMIGVLAGISFGGAAAFVV